MANDEELRRYATIRATQLHIADDLKKLATDWLAKEKRILQLETENADLMSRLRRVDDLLNRVRK